MNQKHLPHPARGHILTGMAGVLALLLLCLPRPGESGPVPEGPVAVEQNQGPDARGDGAFTPLSSTTAPDTAVIAGFDFEGQGSQIGPDPQGWTEVDVTAQTGIFFHVDDFSGLGGAITPISGNQSLWCGSPGDSCWGFTPGYGNNWGQDFATSEFPPVTGDVTMTYRVKWSMDNLSDDHLYVQYQDLLGIWQTLKTYTDASGGALPDTITVPAADHNGTFKVRFRFESDGIWSDEDGVYNSDGPVVIDDIVVTDGTGVVDTQDFEAEAPGAHLTADGRWKATFRSGFGERATLWDGNTVVQENGPVNNSYFWVFFAASPDYYDCGGFPLQKAVPYGPGNEGFYIRNEVRSPWIDITHDENMQPVTSFDSAFLEFDVYRDLPKAVGVFYQWKVRTRVNGGCPGNWSNSAWIYFGDYQAWYRHVGDMTAYIDPGDTEIQIALGVYDCGDPMGAQCPSGVTGGCHSHAPLIDNVQVLTTTTGTQTGVSDTPVSRPTALLAPHPNPARGPIDISFSLAEAGKVLVEIYDVAGRRVRRLAEKSLGAGPGELVWDGRSDAGDPVAGGIYFIRLQTGDRALVRRVLRLDRR